MLCASRWFADDRWEDSAMSLLAVIPQLIVTAATTVEQVGAELTAADIQAAAQTTGIAFAATDDVSLAVAAFFSAHAQEYQTLATEAQNFHQQFADALRGAGSSYSATEAANAAPMESAPAQGGGGGSAQTLASGPLFGNSAEGGALPWRVGGGGGGASFGGAGAIGAAGMLFPAAGTGGQIGVAGAARGAAREEASKGRSAERARAPLSEEPVPGSGARDATRDPEPQSGEEKGESRSEERHEGPITIAPDTSRLTNGAERKVWQALSEQLEAADLVIIGQRVTDHLKDHEIDFIVGIEGAGIVCVEVKGGEVWHDGSHWWQKRRGREVKIDPVRQVRESCYALRKYVERDPRWTRGRLRWDHIVVLPNTDVPEDFALPECPRWKIVDRGQLSTIARRLRHVLVYQELDRPKLDKKGIDQLQAALGGRGFPRRKDPNLRVVENRDEDAVA
jgi:hypothetical protein